MNYTLQFINLVCKLQNKSGLDLIATQYRLVVAYDIRKIWVVRRLISILKQQPMDLEREGTINAQFVSSQRMQVIFI